MKTETKRDFLSAAMLSIVYMVAMTLAFGLSAAVGAVGVCVGVFGGFAIVIVGITTLSNMIFKDAEEE